MPKKRSGIVKWTVSLDDVEVQAVEWLQKQAGLDNPREAIRYAIKRACHEMEYPGAGYLRPVRRRGRPTKEDQ